MPETAYRLTRSKSTVCMNAVPACDDDSCSVLLAGQTSSTSLTCYKRSHSTTSYTSFKNCTATGGSNGKCTTVISVFVGILLFTFLWIVVYCTLEQPIQGFQDSSLAVGWQLRNAQQQQQEQQEQQQHLVITLPHTPFKVLQNKASNSVGGETGRRVLKKVFKVEEQEHGPALQGMGQLFRRGRWAMSELVIAHLAESTSVKDLRLFLRSLHRSGVPARADVVLLFPWRPLPAGMAAMIDQEDESFRLLLRRTPQPTNSAADSAISRAPNNSSSSSSISVFNAAAYWRSADAFSGSKVRVAEPVWGSNINSAHRSSSSTAKRVHKDYWGGWGSVVGFDMQELDPGDALRGFLENPPSELRRWVCYQILLGTVRHKYRNVLLTESQGVFVLGDPLAPARRKSGSLFLFAHESRKWSDPPSFHQQTNNLSLQSANLQPLIHQTSTDHEIVQHDLSEPDHEMDPEQLEEGQDAKDNSLQLLLDSTGKPKTGLTKDDARRLMDRDSTTTSSRPVGLIQQIYGTEIWNGLEKEDRERKVLSTGILMGGIRPVRSLANAMATEMVKVALKRKTRRPFHDEALLNYLIIRSSILRQKVKSHLHMVDSKDSSVHLLPGSNHTVAANAAAAAAAFFQKNGLTRYTIVQGCKSEEIGEERRKAITLALHVDICNSIATTVATTTTSQVYSDCDLQF